MMAMPIWDSMVWLRLLVNTSGATSITRENAPQMIQRPTLRGLNW